ncbi:MAG: RNA methyltransferase [Deltaproteobacteria bacterium]|nr:RNA methyltransferase [Deltaproteobacteria bacterium]
MPTWEVRDPADPRLAPFAALTRSGPRDTVVVEGEIAVERALASSHLVTAVLLTAAHRQRLDALLDPAIPVFVATAAMVREVVGFDFHRGCLAVMPRPVASWTDAVRDHDGLRRVLVAEGLADPANLGAVIRNARALGVDMVLHGRGADPWSRRAIRAAMGLGFSMPVIRCDDLAQAVQGVRARMGEAARVLAAVVQPGAVTLTHYQPPARAIVLVGNEGAGLSEALRAQADDAVTIPLADGVDSLNVAAATAVVLYALAAADGDGGRRSEPRSASGAVK